MDAFPIVSWMVFLPLLGAVLLYAFPMFGAQLGTDGERAGALAPSGAHGSEAHSHRAHSETPADGRARGFTLVITLLTFLISVWMLLGFDGTKGSYQYVEQQPWISAFGVQYFVGVDGISVFLLLLTTFLMPLVVIASQSVHKQVRGYLASMLVLETAMLGTLVALDLFLFYVFWELMLAPMYFIIGIWGGKRRIYATLKFVLYTVVGSLLMLVAIVYVIWQYNSQHQAVTFSLPELLAGTSLSLREELWLFGAFALAFGIKVPIFPFHTWLPDAHVEAPTGGSVILAGVLLKMGLYGLIRFAYPLFPRAAELFAPWIAGLAVIGIIYGALVAWAQTDVKKLVAYSSVSHLGFCVLGVVAFNAVATSGSIFQMLNHGVSTGALFLLVGVLYDRRHTREISEYGGLASQVPVFAFLFLVFTLSSIALPLTNGFIGEFLILSGSFQTFPSLVVFAVTGVVLGAVYMLTLYMKTIFGEIDLSKNGTLEDVKRSELFTLVPLLILVFVMGIFPQPFLKTMQPSVDAWIEQVNSRKQTVVRQISPRNVNSRVDRVSALPDSRAPHIASVSAGT